MTTRSVLTAAAVATLALTAGLAGCSKDSAKETTTTTEAKQKDFQVSTPAGEATLSLDGKLPADWPSGFPTPTGAKPAGSGSLSGEDSGVMVGVYSSSQSAIDAFNFYKSQSSLEPSDAKSFGSSTNFLGSMKIGGGYDGNVTVAALSGTTYIVVVLQTSGSSAGSSTTKAGGSDSSTTTTTTAGGSSSSSTTTTKAGGSNSSTTTTMAGGSSTTTTLAGP